MFIVRLLLLSSVIMTACSSLSSSTKQREITLLALAHGNDNSTQCLKEYLAAIHETATQLENIAKNSRISFDKHSFLKACDRIPISLNEVNAKGNSDQDDSIIQKMTQDLDAIEAKYPSDKYEDSAKIWSIELKKLEHSRFESFFRQLASSVDDQSKQLVDNAQKNIESSIESLLQAILVWQSPDPQETRQYHLESQRFFKAESYLRFLDALQQSVRF